MANTIDSIFGVQGPQAGATSTKITFGVSLKDRTAFEAVKGNVPNGQIVFLKNDQTIYCDGQYFGLSAADAARLDTVISDLSALKTDIGTTTEAYTTLKNSQTTLAQGLLSLKTAIDDKIGNTGIGVHDSGNQSVPNTITEAIAALQTAVASINNGTANVTKVNNKTGDVTLTSDDITMGNQAPQGLQGSTITAAINTKVSISSTDTTNRTNSGIQGATLTTTTQIADAIEAAHAAGVQANTAAATAQSTADGKIAKSPDSTTAVVATGAASGAQSITGVIPAGLQSAANIGQAIEDAAATLVGTSSSWAEGEVKTLGQLRTTLANLQSTVTGLDSTTSTRISNIIKELQQIGDEESGDFANTILDKLMPFLAYSETYGAQGTQGAQGGYYQISTYSNGQTGNDYANNVQDIITKLEAYIDAKANAAQAAATGGAVTGIQATGAVITGNQGADGYKNGQVDILVDSSTVGMQSALAQDGNNRGAAVTTSQSVQDALGALNTAVIAAHTQADTAEADAQEALTKLTWIVI